MMSSHLTIKISCNSIFFFKAGCTEPWSQEPSFTCDRGKWGNPHYDDNDHHHLHHDDDDDMFRFGGWCVQV